MTKIPASLMFVGMLVSPGYMTGQRQQQAPVVATGSGRLQGTRENDLVVFRGVRFAQAPIGALRWRAPQPLLPWTGIQMADYAGPACAQDSAKTADDTVRQENSEDCLTLDMWIPPNLDPSSAVPVIVNIFGGGFVTGTPSAARSDLSAWARSGVIAIGINYRLGTFGWFAHPELTREQGKEGTGNFGLMDQAAALRWVKANIRAFGGDENRITVTGSSAGAISVNMLMLSPLARGLFAQAATISGFGRQPSKSLQAAEAEGTKFAQRHNAGSLEQLRALTTQEILSTPPVSAGDATADDAVGPIVDGVSLPEDVWPAFMAGKEAKVPWIVGSASFDASIAYTRLPDPLVTVYAEETPTQKRQVQQLFNPSGALSATRVAQELLTARIATEPARELAASHAQHGSPTFIYYFDYVASGQRGTEWGAIHGEQNAFFQNNFKALAVAGSYQPSQDDRRMATTMTNAMVNFAKTGNPSVAGELKWKPDSNDQVLVINDRGFAMRQAFEKKRLDLVEELANQHSLP